MSFEIIVTALCTGLVAWGAIRTEIRWLHADVKRQEERIARLESLQLHHKEF